MLKEITKLTVATALLISCYACGNQKSDEQIQAEELLKTAQSNYDNAKYDVAISTIDSLMKKYPGIIDVQRSAMHLKTMITEKRTIADSIANDSIIFANKALVDSLSKQFKYVKTKDMVEGYWVANAINDNHLVQRTDLEARIDDYGEITLATCLYGASINFKTVSAKCPAGEVTTLPANDNYRYSDGGKPVEMVTFNKEKCDTLCQFIYDNKAANITISFNGKRIHTMQLSTKTKNEIAMTYEYATKKAELKKAEDMRLYYSKKLQITRKQVRSTATNINGDKE